MGWLYGDVTLEAEDRAHIESVQISSDTEKRIASFRLKLATDVAPGLTVRVTIPGVQPIDSEVAVNPNGEAEAVIEVPLPNAPLWSPDHPDLLTASIQLLHGDYEIDRVDHDLAFAK